MINWSSLWSAFFGSIPGIVTSIVLLVMNNRNSKKIVKLQNQNSVFLIWHQKRIEALVEIYEAFRKYLDFLRRNLYIPSLPGSMDPYFEFRTTIDKNLVYLDDAMQQKINQIQGELLMFWNWAIHHPRPGGLSDADEVQRKLDYEIPGYLDILRKEINYYGDPKSNIKNED